MPRGNQRSEASETVTVRVPIAFRRRNGRKSLIAPEGSSGVFAQSPVQVDRALIKVIARAFRWRKLIESGAYSTIQELATAEDINSSYVSRILRLTLLSPVIVEAALDGRPLTQVSFALLMKPFPVEWDRQREFVHMGLAPPLPQDGAVARA